MMQLSKIIAGTMTWGTWGKNLSLKDMEKRLHFCIENGITTFDHADIYGAYTTEEAFGKAFKNSAIKRGQLQLITKCGIQYVCEQRQNTIKHYNYSKDYIIWSAETSLKNLQTEYLDVFLLHRPSPLMHPDEIAEAVLQLKAQGKIKHFGVSNFTASQMAMLQSKTPVEVNQIECSLTTNQAMHNGLLDTLIKDNVQPMAWSPLGTVFKENTPQTERINAQLEPLVEKYNATKDQLLLAWLIKHPANILPVVGTTNTNRLLNAIKATKIELELEDWFSLLVASQGHKVP